MAGQGAGDEQPMGVLLKNPGTDRGAMKHAFEDAEDLLHAAADSGLDTVTGPLGCVHNTLVTVTPVREVLYLGACCRRTSV